MTRIVKTVAIELPLEEAHTAARDPHHWTEWVAGLGDRGEVDGIGDVGSFGEFDLLMAGVHIPVRMEVLEDTHSPDRCFCRTETVGGGVRAVVTFTYTPQGAETLITAELDYELPGAVLGKIADRLLVERLEERSLEHTLGNLKVLAEATRPVLVA